MIRLLNDILKNKEQLDAARPLPKHTLRTLQEKLFLEWTYNSNVEGNTLTLNETRKINNCYMYQGV